MPHSYDLDIDDSARARRRRASSSSSSTGDINVKALGSNLGDIAKGRVVFDPNAYDGDGDGIVQDGTPFERPAVLSNVAALARGFASATGKWGDSFDNWTAGKTNEEIAEVLVPDNPADLLAYFAAHIGAHGYPLGLSHMSMTELATQLGLNSEDIDFSPESIAAARKAYADMLYQFPHMKALLEIHGHPPIIVSKEEAYARGAAGSMQGHALMRVARQVLDAPEKFSSDAQLREKIGAKLAQRGIDKVLDRFFGGSEFNARYMPALLRQSFNGEFNPFLTTLVHEYGHYLHHNAVLNHPDPKVRRFLSELAHKEWNNLDIDKLPPEWAEFVRRLTMDRYTMKVEDLSSPSELRPPSLYGLVNPKEFIAEVFTSAFTGKDVIDRPWQDLIEDISATRPYPSGFASRSSRPEHLVNAGAQRIAEMVVPENAEQARAHILDNIRYLSEIGGEADNRTDDEIIDEVIKAIGKEIDRPDAKTLDDIFSFAPEDLASMRKAIEARLSSSELMMTHVERFGMPPVMAVKSDSPYTDAFMSVRGAPVIAFATRMLQEAGDSEDGKLWGAYSSDHSPKLDGTDFWLVSGATRSLESTLAHEYGHYLNYMTAITHPDSHVRALAAFWFAEKWEHLTGNKFRQWRTRRWIKKNPGWELSADTADRRFGNVQRLINAINNGESLDMFGDLPFVHSQYGQSMPLEMFAEAYQALTSRDPEQIQRVSMEMANDVMEMLSPVGPRAPQPIERVVDSSMGDAARARGFASLSITRDARGNRSVDKAFLGIDDSPLNGPDWLKNATNDEIVQALVPRSVEDAVRLISMNMLYGDIVPDPQTLATVRAVLASWLDPALNGGVDLIDFSPDGIAKMEKFLKNALDNSPEFAWMVRRFGSAPFMPSNPRLMHTIWGQRGTDGRLLMQHPDRNMRAFISPLIGGPTMGFAIGDAFIILNTSHNGWEGWHDPSRQLPVFGQFDKSTVNQIATILGNRYVNNFGLSVEGTIIHEWAHTLWSRYFGDTYSIGYKRRGLTGDRNSRAAYLFPNLPLQDALTLIDFARGTFKHDSFSTLYAGHNPAVKEEWERQMQDIIDAAEQLYGAGSVNHREVERRIKQFDTMIRDNGHQLMSQGVIRPDSRLALLYNDPNTEDAAAYFLGWDADLTEQMWKLMALDFPEVFGDPRLEIASIKNRYAQKTAQESWAELVALAATPDERMRQKYLTPGLQATLGYMLGEHDNPVSASGLILPWSAQPRGFASRAERIDVARNNVGMRASNADAIVHAMSVSDSAIGRGAEASIEDTGMINMRVGDYSFSVPGEQYMPRFNSAYTEWASENHRSMQAISSMMMGLPDGHGLLGDNPVSELNEYDKANIRTSAARAARLMQDIADSDTYSSYPLFHTIGNVSKDDQLLKASIGDSVHLPLVSFTPEHVDPSELRRGLAPTVVGNTESAIIKLAIGARVVDSDITKHGYLHDQWRKQPLESITNGKFRITNIDELNGHKLIEVEHSDVFHPYEGKFNPITSDGWERARDINSEWMNDLRQLESEHRTAQNVVSDISKDREERAQRIIEGMLGGDASIPQPTFSLSPDEKRREESVIQSFIDSKIPSADTRGLPGFASTSDSTHGFNRTLRPEQRVSKSARRMLADNREYIVDRQMSSRDGSIIDEEWLDNMTERLRNGEITHQESMDLMNILMDVMGNRIKNNPSERDATEGDMYHYQKLGKRLRRMMVAGVSDEDMDRIRNDQGIRTGRRGFASDSSRVQDELVSDFTPRVVTGSWMDGGDDDAWPNNYTPREKTETIVYKINGEDVTFGLRKNTTIDTTGIKSIPLNPYEITGFERGSKEGEDMAIKWVYATAALNGSTNGTETSALLYAGMNGDKKAMAKFEELAKLGEEQTKAIREQNILNNAVESGAASDWNVGRLAVSAAMARAKAEGREISLDEAEEIAKTRAFSIDDLALVRWTEFPPEYDDEGNIILHPYSHHSGGQGQPFGVDRETVHFTLNHTVSEHMGWQAQGSGYSIIIPLRDVMADNPDSLDALKDVDTYFTPAPGRGLKLRKGSVRVVEVSDISQRSKLTNDALGEMGFAVVAGGPHYSDTPGFGTAVNKIEQDLGRPRSRLHANMPHSQLEKVNASASENSDFAGTGHIYPFALADMDRNAILRMADKKHNPFVGEVRTSVSPPGAPGGFISSSAGVKKVDLSTRVDNPQHAEIIRSIEDKIKQLTAKKPLAELSPPSGQRLTGFASRSDTYSVQEPIEDIVRNLELSEKEIGILEEIFPSIKRLLEAPFNPALESERQRILDSIRIGVGDDGIPFIYAEPHPLLVDLFPDKRDWGAVMAPRKERILEIRDALEQVAAKAMLKTDRNEDGRAKRYEEIVELEKTFGKWAMSLFDGIASRHPIAEDDDRHSEISMLTWLGLYTKALHNMSDRGIRTFFGDSDYLNAHDLLGHVGTGRGFDRHGEWTNMLAMHTLMDRWAEENNIPERDLLALKLKWFAQLEQHRITGRFDRDREEPSPNFPEGTEWWERQTAIGDVTDSGTASIEDMRKLVALFDDGNTHPTSRSRGFASATSTEKAEFSKFDVVRNIRRSSNEPAPKGFASASSDWKTGTHNIQVRDEVPNAEIAHAAEGRTAQREVKVGNQVKHPTTGQMVNLDTVDDSIDYVAAGGDLSSVPDDHLLESILRNTQEIVGGEERSGFNLTKENGRFIHTGTGTGVHGMVLFEDTKTGAQFGIKYEASWNWGREEIHPITRDNAATTDKGILSELGANAFMEQFGYEPMPMRIVKRSDLGAGEFDRQQEDKRHGAAMITELAQNRYRSVTNDIDARSRRLGKIGLLRMKLVDALIGNDDRHDENLLASRQGLGNDPVVIPIDQGASLMNGSMRTTLAERLTSQFRNSGDSLEGLTLNEIQRLVAEIMPDFRDDIDSKIEKIRAEAAEIMKQHARVTGTRFGSHDHAELFHAMDVAISRWQELAAMTDEEIAREIHGNLSHVPLSKRLR